MVLHPPVAGSRWTPAGGRRSVPRLPGRTPWASPNGETRHVPGGAFLTAAVSQRDLSRASRSRAASNTPAPLRRRRQL